MLNAYAQALVAGRAKTPVAIAVTQGEMLDVSITARDVGTLRRTLVTRELMRALRPRWNADAAEQEGNLRVLLRVAGQAMRGIAQRGADGGRFSAFIVDGRDRLGKTQHRELWAYVSIDGRRGHAVIDLARKEGAA